ncbi:MAG TPA: hypothetical protein VKY89_07830 [Thermoanaerobaculia bacterium]|jgi:hypothetical protein|nr:hypothetical protein [Thermoanaerobaculia bacterium]
MITGYNTDVRHHEVVFHVQTEDKGAANPFIESLVYVGGQVLASKRASYADLLAEGRDEKEIIALMDHQHRTMIAAIRHGKLDGKLVALVRPKTSPMPVLEPVPAGGGPSPRGPGGSFVPADAAGPSAFQRTATPRGLPVQSPAQQTPQAPQGPQAPPTSERTLDQVILEYLTNEADQEQLVLVLEGEAELGLGRRASLALRTTSSKSGLPIAGAQVSVRMISTISEPRVLAVGRTDEYGGLPLRFEIPALDRGTAALIISAVSAIGRAELKHLL